ncbi:hypothetical protein JCM3775_005198 [Rhodotorula graminis]
MAAAAPPTPAPRPPRQRLNKLERTQLRRDLAHHDKDADHRQDDDDQATTAPLDWLPLADTRTHQCPVVFTPDGSYAFIASGAAVKVYSVASTQLMSTLSIRPYSSSTATTTNEPAALRRATVSAVLLSPSNPRQLVVAATDGKVRLWDYLDGALLRTLDLGAPILHATANHNLADHLFVALGTNSNLDAEASVYLVSLRAAKHLVDGVVTAADPSTPVQPARRVRLATPRIVRALALSHDGAVLASVNPNAVHLARTHDIQRGFTQSVPAADDEVLTTVAFHPTDNYFATGNERGQIRLWYNVLGAPSSSSEAGDCALAAPAPTTSVLHWHAHAVSSLAFTPNGAYLLSGGQEAVLVLWQLHTGHQEYVPRLGAPISSLTVLDGTRDNPEQQVAARLSDGSVAFVGSQRLRVGKVISGLKADASSRPTFAPAPSTLPTPLALDPSTSALVLPAAHPSSLQFYSPLDDASILELEVAPSNRVTSAQRDRPLEPTRVERVAFSTPEPRGAGAYWMATVDSWAKDGFTPVRQLKLWRKQVGAAAAEQQQQHSFALSTRIDRPHDGPITSLAFSPSTASPLLLTTSTDGSIKVWAPTTSSSSSSSASSGGAWACRAALSHRGSAPVAAAWSADGSMFAVAHVRGSVTLWSLAQGGVLMHSFAATSVGRPRHVAFVDGEGERSGGDGATALVVAGSRGSIAWDLLTLDEVHTTSIDFATLAVQPGSGLLLGTEDAVPTASTSASASSASASSSNAGAKKAVTTNKAGPSATSTDGAAPALLYSLPVASTSREAALAHLDARPLPFALRQLLPLPSSASASSSSAATTSSRRTDAHPVSLAAVDPTGAVSLLGAAAALGGSVAPSALPQAAGTGAKEGLFDEIFGSASAAAAATSAGASRAKGKGRALLGDGSAAAAGARIDVGALGKGAAVLLETPAHVLPPVRMLWRELLRVEQRPAAVELELEGGDNGSRAATAAAATGAATSPPQQQKSEVLSATTTAPVFSSLGQETMRGIFSRRLAGGVAGSA